MWNVMSCVPLRIRHEGSFQHKCRARGPFRSTRLQAHVINFIAPWLVASYLASRAPCILARGIRFLEFFSVARKTFLNYLGGISLGFDGLLIRTISTFEFDVFSRQRFSYGIGSEVPRSYYGREWPSSHAAPFCNYL